MPSVKLVTISVIIGVIVVVGVGFSISSRPVGNNEKPNTNQEFKQLSRIDSTQVYHNPIMHQVFLNNSTHIDTPYIKEYSMPNGTWPNAILVARNGIVWTVGTMSHTLISFDPKQG
jgi:streptogramin lyase